MKTFTQHQGVAAPLIRNNVDTDAIIPSREMKLVSKQGLGEGLFAGWRYLNPAERQVNPEFVLNQAAYQNTSILLSGMNFGCGSSREHAVWALKEFGIQAVIAASFGTIFYNNCTRNGILPIVLPEQAIDQLMKDCSDDPQINQINIDLPGQQVLSPSGAHWHFDIEAAPKEMLVEGLDPIALTLKQADRIEKFEERYQQQFPWLQ
ncbi:3-isopropylmalate dehydratase small subunit [Aestuariicella hydrocarbonica]|uniref:3-isopropylmalate dehydratase small subunit n=1 Tax=Pseudomaricurvus hydrocarbonicus TaxID=1470433 RepID=A0A9E5MN12_9GAMM|nr:3-isopropylmalate dehydratase small subunit [Aestuariicella hydrocarbonica]NHO67236.1 3-isopropylmalate dehydratase small subunit [Aestuariicella hydrocarbonica]